MEILDPGHIYKISCGSVLTFVKRSGGAIQYEKEWPGIQTQAVMRALIAHFELLQYDPDYTAEYALWQLGSPETAPLVLSDTHQTEDVIRVLDDRSKYLFRIIECVETHDACFWLQAAISSLQRYRTYGHPGLVAKAAYKIRQALWNYEARAYRRKQEKVNREQPQHDDSERLRPWRDHLTADVPFGPHAIELRPIGEDGHIVL